MRRRAGVITAAIVIVIAGATVAVTRPAPRHSAPLALDTEGIHESTVVWDRKGRAVISNFRTVEPGVLYRGSAFPTSFPVRGGEKEYADETAFNFLRYRNIRHVIALVGSADAYYAEDGYLRHWSERTGFPISTTWVQIEPTAPYAMDDRGGLHAAGILISLMRERVGGGGSVYIHDIDGVHHVGVAVAGYELWRNRGWNDFDTVWTLVERRFLVGNRTMAEFVRVGGRANRTICPDGVRAYVCAAALSDLRDELRFVIEL